MKDVSLKIEFFAYWNNRIDVLQEQIRLKDLLIKQQDTIIAQQEELINKLGYAIKNPKYKYGDIVNIIGEGDEKYLVEACTAYMAEYSLKSITDNTIRESIIEFDIVETY
jgi:hypothetical protein